MPKDHLTKKGILKAAIASRTPVSTRLTAHLLPKLSLMEATVNSIFFN